MNAPLVEINFCGCRDQRRLMNNFISVSCLDFRFIRCYVLHSWVSGFFQQASAQLIGDSRHASMDLTSLFNKR